MRILHLSDTHNCHRSIRYLPAADVIIHSGDAALSGNKNEIADFLIWFGGLDYKYKIFVAGNHDHCPNRTEFIQNFLHPDFYHLCNSGVTIDGIKFWGISYYYIPQMIPADTDILISHRPPFGILDKIDKSYGCIHLLQAVLKLSPRYHLFGHVHGAYGIEKSETTTFVNASVVNENDELTNKPFVFEI